MTSAQKSHGSRHGKISPQAPIENVAAVQPHSFGYSSCLPGSVANPTQNQKSSFISIFPFKAIQRDSKAFKAIQRFFRKKRLFISLLAPLRL
jgi:hypothetical protein